MSHFQTTKMLLDCDTGIDDTLAILFAALDSRIDLLGVGSTWGNVDVATATDNTSYVLALVGRTDIPVAVGAAGPINGSAPCFAMDVHGADGQGNVGSRPKVGEVTPHSAAELIIETARKYPNEVQLVAVGPMTNLALALQLCPDLPRLLKGITVMGGAANCPGNSTAAAEANIYADPEAAAAVFAADWDLTMVGLDVTMKAVVTEDHVEQLRGGGSLGRYVAAMLDHYCDYYAATTFPVRQACVHDALAVAVAAGLVKLLVAPHVYTQVDTGYGPGRGQTICDLRGKYNGFPPQNNANCRVVLECETKSIDEMVSQIVAFGDARAKTPTR